MGLFDMFKKKKPRTVYDELMDIPGFREQKELLKLHPRGNISTFQKLHPRGDISTFHKL